MRGVLGRLIAFGPHQGAHRIAARAGVSILVPLLVLATIDRLDWSIFAAFGAFTSLYGRERAAWHRFRLQVTAGFTQTACVTIGALVGTTAYRSWLSVPIGAAIAFGAAYVSTRDGWHPPGALFQVFAFAAVASVPGRLSGVPTAAAVAGLAAAFAVVVGSLAELGRRLQGRPTDADESNTPIGGASEGLARFALQSAIGVLLAGVIATGAHIGRPYWAMVSAVVPLVSRDLGVQLVRGLHRIIGTLLGLLIAWALLVADLHTLVLVFVIAALQAAAELVVGRNYALALVFVTPLALMMVHLVAPVDTRTLLVDRGLETLIGAVIGMAIGYASRPQNLRRRRTADV